MSDLIEILLNSLTFFVDSQDLEKNEESKNENFKTLLSMIIFGSVITILVSVMVFFKPKHIVKEIAVAETKHIIINQEKKVMAKIDHKLNIAKTPISINKDHKNIEEKHILFAKMKEKLTHKIEEKQNNA